MPEPVGRLEWNEQLQRWHDHETGYDITLPVPPHDYLSTSCLHGLHERCAEKGARCKFCGERCRCECHADRWRLVREAARRWNPYP